MAELNETIHQPVRLRIMAALVTLDTGNELDFTYLRKLLDVTDGNLASHLKGLEKEEYILVHKSFLGRKPNTNYEATEKGKKAFKLHLDALEQLIKQQKTK